MPAGEAGFTLIEMLVVLSIMGLLMGIAVGAFRHSIPSRDIAYGAVRDQLRQARLFAISENAPATVRLEPGTDDRWPTVCATGRKTVASWHLEGSDLAGWPDDAHASGLADAGDSVKGALGKAVVLSDNQPSWIDFGTNGAFDAPEGFALEFFVKVEQPRNQVLFSKGKGVVLRSEADGGLTAQIRVVGKDDKGAPREVYHSVSSPGAVLQPGRFVKVAVTFDGVQLRVSGDDAIVAELVLQARAAFSPDRSATLMCGVIDQPAALTLDEVKWGIFTGDSQELRDMELGPGTRLVRFAPDGTLDPRFHQKPAELCLLTPTGDPDKKPAETWIRIGMLGDVH